jgi:Rieske Fe-S protein
MRSIFLVATLALVACDTGKTTEPAKPEPIATATATADGALHLGAPIEANAQKVALTEVAKNPDAYVGKTFATTGTVTAVCQHMGCWMEIKDDSGEAHVKMAGHSFFVPKTASGRKAKVLATLVKNDEEGACAEEGANGDKKAGCKAEAEKPPVGDREARQLGRPLAKLELVAQGVELL